MRVTEELIEEELRAFTSKMSILGLKYAIMVNTGPRSIVKADCTNEDICRMLQHIAEVLPRTEAAALGVRLYSLGSALIKRHDEDLWEHIIEIVKEL